MFRVFSQYFICVHEGIGCSRIACNKKCRNRVSPVSPRGDKVSILTNTYTHKPLRKIKVTICNHQADTQLMSDLVTCKFRKVWSYMTLNALTETRRH